MINTTIAPCQVTAKLGQGGMGGQSCGRCRCCNIFPAGSDRDPDILKAGENYLIHKDLGFIGKLRKKHDLSIENAESIPYFQCK